VINDDSSSNTLWKKIQEKIITTDYILLYYISDHKEVCNLRFLRKILFRALPLIMLLSVFTEIISIPKTANASPAYVEEFVPYYSWMDPNYNPNAPDPNAFYTTSALQAGYVYTLHITVLAGNQSVQFYGTPRANNPNQNGDIVKYTQTNTSYNATVTVDGDLFSHGIGFSYYDSYNFTLVGFSRHPKSTTTDYNNPYNVWEYMYDSMTRTYSNFGLDGTYQPTYYYDLHATTGYRYYIRFSKSCYNYARFRKQLKDGTWEAVTEYPPTQTTGNYCTESHDLFLDGDKYTGIIADDISGNSVGGSYGIGIYLFNRQIKNTPPTLNLTSTDINLLSADAGFSSFFANGFVSDPNDGDMEIVTATVGGISKSVTLNNTSVAKPFSIPFDVITDNLPNGTYPVIVTVNDQNGGTDTKTFNITIKARAKNNLYVLVDDPIYFPPISYSDRESDPQNNIRWKFTHDPNFFENSTGIIPDSGVWRSTAYTSFPKPGHYTIVVQGQDMPAKYSKWSNNPFTKMNIFVHRRPVAVFSPTVYTNGSGGFIVVPNDESYDLDLQSDSSHGIAQWEYNWKLVSDTAWTNGLPPQNIPASSNFQLKLKVLDKQGVWSYPVTQLFSTINPPSLPAPTAVMTIPNGTQANPTLFASTKPTFTWSQTSTSAGMVFKQYQIQVTDSPNSTMIYDSFAQGQNTSSNTNSFIMPSNLPSGQAMRVRVRVADSNATWSNWSSQTWFYINSPPTGNLTFSTPIYQNDTPTFTITQSDPDNDPLTIKVDASFNGGSYSNIAQWTGVPSGTSKVFTYGPLAQGVYTLKLTLDDLKGGTYIQTYSFTVLPLTITGAITHTVDWEAYRQQWNAAGRLPTHNTIDFWAGEALELTSAVTNTGASSTKPSSVTATLVQTGDNTGMTSSDNVNFKGEIANANFIHTLSNGAYVMRFKVTWNNGLIQTTDVPFNIKGNIFDVIVTQLRD
jgi:hypothetical protein